MVPAVLSYAGCRYWGELTPRTGSVGFVRLVLAARSKLPAATPTGLIATSLRRLSQLGCAPATGEFFFIMAFARSISACSLHAVSSAANLFLIFALRTLEYGFSQGHNRADLRETQSRLFYPQEYRPFQALPFTSISRYRLPGNLAILAPRPAAGFIPT